MTHFRSFFDNNYVGVWDLGGKPRVATIAKVTAGSVGGGIPGRKAARKIVLHLEEFDAPMVCNVTNGTTIAGMYGQDVSKWKGKLVTLFPTTTQVGKDSNVPCIRIKPTVPNGKPEHVGSRPVDREVRDRQKRAAGEAPHPAQPIADATDRASLLAALGSCAPWIDGNARTAWPKIAQRCEDCGVTVLEAEAAVNEALEATP